MAEYCGQCIHLDWNNKERYSSTDRYYCNDKRRYIEPKDTACRYFIKDKSISNAGGYKGSGCYITTIIVDILGYEDNCEVLNTLRNFRDITLKSNIEYLPLLFEYDQVGPIIAQCIINEKNNYQFCLGLLKHFLIPCAELIKLEAYDEAIKVYQNMVMSLNDSYDLPMINVSIPEEYSLEEIGKGRVRQLKTIKNCKM